LQKQADVTFGTSNNATKITVNEATKYQNIDGFGHCMTEGSAEVICRLTPQMQDSVLNNLFNVKTGIGMEVMRISLGASDLGNGVYSYDDVTGGDPTLAKFSLKGVDSMYLVPVLKKVVAINPNIKILSCPWSAPAWMKTNNSFKGGNVPTTNYPVYANYFVKYIQAMKANGIPIWGITIQNEPENPGNTPSCVWTKEQETSFINNNLGPAFKAAGIATKIIAFDHNCDHPDYPTYVCNNSTYVDGSAFHLYAGSISAMTTVYNATHKDVYFTEQCTCSGDFSGNFSGHVRSVMMGSLTNWAKFVMEWNLATDANLGPHTDNGGCGICYGGVMVNSATAYSLYASYYVGALFSKVIRANSVRVAASSSGNLSTIAAVNPDGSRALVVYNGGSAATFDVVWNGKSFPYTLGANSGASFIWQGPVAVKEAAKPAQFAFAKLENYPEPFTASTRITINLTKNSDANVAIFDCKGSMVTTLLHGVQTQGSHSITWNGTDTHGRTVAAGVYVVKARTDGLMVAKRMLKE
jgi:glucosylceramidase